MRLPFDVKDEHYPYHIVKITNGVFKNAMEEKTNLEYNKTEM